MIVIPAIDLRGGKCVRLLHGEFNQETIYSDNPVEVAQKWIQAGIASKLLHPLSGILPAQRRPRQLLLVLEGNAS